MHLFNINSAKPLFGDNAKAFEAELCGALLSLNRAGVFSEQIETEVVIAPKRQGGGLRAVR